MRVLNTEQCQNIGGRFGQCRQYVNGFGWKIATLLGTITASNAPAIVQYCLAGIVVFEGNKVAFQERQEAGSFSGSLIVLQGNDKFGSKFMNNYNKLFKVQNV